MSYTYSVLFSQVMKPFYLSVSHKICEVNGDDNFQVAVEIWWDLELPKVPGQ